ncbi:hypothetical protein BDD14_6540 [Edaphobacter modestus]|uniref:Uncharacterized protein n=1 Tax=Edaphobacter modestus TaxID=388466 RepID=A0A4Q7XYE5_9BACT|nr:hypothetical protein BDD14_6540 [Edaphobacter modestus]
MANFLDDFFDGEAGDHGKADLAAEAGTFGLKEGLDWLLRHYEQKNGQARPVPFMGAGDGVRARGDLPKA